MVGRPPKVHDRHSPALVRELTCTNLNPTFEVLKAYGVPPSILTRRS